MLLDSSVVECKLIDLPVIPRFPDSTQDEWNNFKHFGLRSASVYILVYDVSNPETFAFIKKIREQILDLKDASNALIIVAANKSDLVQVDEKTRSDTFNTVRKSWNSVLIECSAKHNWNITDVFREVAKEVIEQQNTTGVKESSIEEPLHCCRIFNY